MSKSRRTSNTWMTMEMREEVSQEEQLAPSKNSTSCYGSPDRTYARVTGSSTDTSPYKDAEGNIDLEQLEKKVRT